MSSPDFQNGLLVLSGNRLQKNWSAADLPALTMISLSASALVPSRQAPSKAALSQKSG